VEVEWGRVRAQAVHGEEWGRGRSGSGGDRSMSVKQRGHVRGVLTGGDRGGTWAAG
jgi:hypothetical protein